MSGGTRFVVGATTGVYTLHIEPGIVDGAKMALSYITAAAAGGVTLKSAVDNMREAGVLPFVFRAAISTGLVFCFFQVFPHYPVGVSEVHLILGSTLFLLFGMAPAACGLALGLLTQGLLFAPFDLPQYFINVTTLLVPLFAVSMLARRIIAPDTPYVDLNYGQALALSTAYQAGIVGWVAFWAFYGHWRCLLQPNPPAASSAVCFSISVCTPQRPEFRDHKATKGGHRSPFPFHSLLRPPSAPTHLWFMNGRAIGDQPHLSGSV
jgi:ABC-type Co2+ transport system permease subunit